MRRRFAFGAFVELVSRTHTATSAAERSWWSPCPGYSPSSPTQFPRPQEYTTVGPSTFSLFVSKRRKYCKVRNSETSWEARFHCHFTTDDCPLLKWRKKHKIQTWTRRPGKYKIISKKKIRKIRKKTKIRTHFPAGGVSGKD